MNAGDEYWKVLSGWLEVGSGRFSEMVGDEFWKVLSRWVEVAAGRFSGVVVDDLPGRSIAHASLRGSPIGSHL